jgi:hypothetical protein
LLLLSAYLLVDGICAIVAGMKLNSNFKRGYLLIADGVFRGVMFLFLVVMGGGAFGIFTLALIVAGIIEVAAAVRLRKHLSGSFVFALGGAVSILFFPFLIFIATLRDALYRQIELNLLIMTGGFFVLFGLLTLVFGLTMRGSVRQPN